MALLSAVSAASMPSDADVDTAVRAGGRLGLAARGVMYGVMGWLAAQVAAGDFTTEADPRGAFRTLADQPAGTIALLALLAGYAGLAVWRLSRVRDEDGVRHRLVQLWQASIAAGLCVLSLRVLVGSGDPGESGGAAQDSTRQASSTVFDLPAGRWLVGGIGLGVMGAAGWQVWKGLTRRFEDDLNLRELSKPAEHAVIGTGVAGHAGRGIALAIVGGFLLGPAATHDPNQPKGLDVALTDLARSGQGPWVVGAVAAGFTAFGLFLLVAAVYRRRSAM